MDSDMVGDRCSLYGVGKFKSTLSVYISNRSTGSGIICHHQKNTTGHQYNNLATSHCRACSAKRASQRPANNARNGFRVIPSALHHNSDDNNIISINVLNKNNGECGFKRRWKSQWPSDVECGDHTGDHVMTLSNMVVSSLEEGISVCANVSKSSYQLVESRLDYKDRRRFKNQILVCPGLCPSPTAMAETNFMFLTNTHKRFKNRVFLHNRQFKMIRHVETVCITPKSLHKNYTTTLNHDLGSPAPWFETKMEFRPKNYRSVYHIRFSNNTSSNTPRKFTFKKWQYAEINNGFGTINHIDLKQQPYQTTKCHHNKARQSTANQVCDYSCAAETQSNCNEIIITNVLNDPLKDSNLGPKHRYFTMEQN